MRQRIHSRIIDEVTRLFLVAHIPCSGGAELSGAFGRCAIGNWRLAIGVVRALLLWSYDGVILELLWHYYGIILISVAVCSLDIDS